VEGVNREGPG